MSSSLSSYRFDAEIVSQKNCENLIGSVEVPVGSVGPVQVKGDILAEEIVIPIATTEGALVASLSRGSKAINHSGGCELLVKKVGMSRAPVFKCVSGRAAMEFAEWLNDHQIEVGTLAEATSSHLKFLVLHTWIRGTYVYARFVFDTDEAMGMNMVTIGLQQAWEQLQAQFPEVKLLSLSSNVCSDKKDSQINRLLGRGYWVQVEVVVPDAVLTSVLKTTSQELLEVHIVKNLMGSNLAGSFSQNMQAGNAVAGVYLATGQDMAHVTEGSQATTTMELREGGLYVAVTLPNIAVGTVGGGTWLPAQSEARDLIRHGQPLSAQQLAGVVGVAALAGELSGLAALASNSLAQAHQRLARIPKSNL